MGTNNAKLLPFTIPSGGGAGPRLDLTGLTALELLIPAGATTADITAEIAHLEAGPWGVFTGEDGKVWTVPDVPESTCVRFDERSFQDIKYLRFLYGSQGSDVDCTLKVLPMSRVLR